MAKGSFTQRQFAHGSIYALSRFLNQGAGFLLLPVLARYLGSDGFGMLSLATTVAGIVSVFLMQGQNASWFRLRFRYPPEEHRELDSTILWYVIGSYTVGILLLCTVGPALCVRWLPGVPFFPVLLMALVIETGTELIGLFQRKQQAEQKPTEFLLVALFRSVASLVLAIVLVVFFRQGVVGKLWADLLVTTLIAGGFILVLRPLPPWRSSKEKLGASLTYGAPLIFHQLGSNINSVSDRALINYFVGLGPSGIYAMGYKLASVGIVLSTALNQAFATLMYDALAKGDSLEPEDRERQYAAVRKNALYQTVAVAWLLLGVSAFSREALRFRASREFEAAWSIMPVLSLGILVQAAYQPLSGTVLFYNRVKALPIATLLSALVNVLLNVLLLPRLGIAGAAYATLISNAILFFAAAVIANPLFRTYDWPRLVALFLVATTAFSIFWLADSRVEDLLLRLVLKTLVFALSSAALFVASGLKATFLLKSLRSLLKIG